MRTPQGPSRRVTFDFRDDEQLADYFMATMGSNPSPAHSEGAIARAEENAATREWGSEYGDGDSGHRDALLGEWR